MYMYMKVYVCMGGGDKFTSGSVSPRSGMTAKGLKKTNTPARVRGPAGSMIFQCMMFDTLTSQ